MKLNPKEKAYLLLEDGTLITGTAIGKKATVGGEICFNTGMTGYQEIYTDPSYTGQIIINTSSHIGNYGVFEKEQESSAPKIKGIVVNEFSEEYSRSTADQSLQNYLERHGVVGIAEIDTRRLVRHIRSKGAMNAIISSDKPKEELQGELEKVPSMEGLELSSTIGAQEPYFFGEEDSKYKVAVLDLGIKTNILINLKDRGCYCKVFPAKASYEDMAEWGADGYFISNGPGDPAVMDYAVDTVKAILDADVPLFGICLGHQMLARAYGITTYKMHHGHRGLNHPVKNILTGKSEITSQNHGFVIKREDVEKSDEVEITHVHLNDNTVAGLKIKKKKAFSVQYHPESSPGPHDSRYLFDQFIDLMS